MSYTAPTALNGSTAALVGTLAWGPSYLAGSAPSLLLHFDGANGQTTTVDSSPYANVVSLFAVPSGTQAMLTTAHASPVGDTAVLSCLSDPTLSTSNTAMASVPLTFDGPLDMTNTPAWTIEGFIWIPQMGGFTQTFINLGAQIDGSSAFNGIALSSGGGGTYPANGDLHMTIYSPTSGPGATPSFSNVTAGVWHHFAMVKQLDPGGSGFDIYQLFLDGVGSGWTPTSPGFLGPYTQWTGYLGIGGFWSDFYGTFNPGHGAYYSEIRITKGLCLYTTAFTPPTVPFSDSGTPAPGYDVYRGGVSIATFLGPPGYIDTVPTPGPYTYEVYGWDGTSDVSPASNPLTLSYGGSSTTVNVYGKFAPAPGLKPPILFADANGIGPRIYMPRENVTVKT